MITTSVYTGTYVIHSIYLSNSSFSVKTKRPEKLLFSSPLKVRLIQAHDHFLAFHQVLLISPVFS